MTDDTKIHEAHFCPTKERLKDTVVSASRILENLTDEELDGFQEMGTEADQVLMRE